MMGGQSPPRGAGCASRPNRIIASLAGLATLITGCTHSNDSFVRVADGQFVVNDQAFRFVGVNFWHAMHLGMREPPGDRLRLGRELDRLKEHGVTNIRVLASSEGPDTAPYRVTPSLMPEPGRYNPQVLDGLDYLIGELATRDMTAVLVLTNFWEWSGGMAQYVAWHDHSSIPYPADHDWRDFCRYAERFYTIEQCQRWYQKHITAMITRRNPHTGRTYRDEPAILSWELANEPRYYPSTWIDDTARHIKSLDANHMVTTGSEGRIGGPFVESHRFTSIDYATIHIWPQNWGWFDPESPASLDRALGETSSYLSEHFASAAQLGKPVVVEEFGLARDHEPGGNVHDPRATTALRDRFFEQVFTAVEDSARAGGPAAGTNLWCWSGEARPGSRYLGDPPHEPPGWYSVYDTDQSTLRLIRRHARSLGDLARCSAKPN